LYEEGYVLRTLVRKRLDPQYLSPMLRVDAFKNKKS